MNKDKLISVTEAAALRGVSRYTIYKWMAHGLIARRHNPTKFYLSDVATFERPGRGRSFTPKNANNS